MSHCLLPSSGFNVHKDYDVDGLWTFSGGPPAVVFDVPPTGTTHETSTLVINPASADADDTPFWLGINGTAKLRVYGNGDVTAAGRLRGDTIQADNHIYISGGFASIVCDANYTIITSNRDSGLSIRGNDIASDQVYMGEGHWSQRTLAAHLTQDCVTIKRDVDGDGGTYNEAGSLLHLHRDITNAGTEAGNFVECSTDGSTPIFRVDKDGGVLISGSIGHYGSAIGVFSHSGSGQASHIADVPAAAGDPPTKAEFDAFATKFNQLLYDLEQWGWHANS